MDTATHTAVAAIRTAEGNGLLAAETEAAAAAVAGLHLQCCFINELHQSSLRLLKAKNKNPGTRAGVSRIGTANVAE
jgi:hypothetical protein